MSFRLVICFVVCTCFAIAGCGEKESPGGMKEALSGKKEAPSCGDKVTTDTVTRLITRPNPGMIQAFEYEGIKTLRTDENGDRYCRANVTLVTTWPDGRPIRDDWKYRRGWVEYTSILDDKGQHWVSIKGIDDPKNK